MPAVTVGEVREQIEEVRSVLHVTAELLYNIRPDLQLDPNPIQCPPIILPAGRGCDVMDFTRGDPPITVEDVWKAVEKIEGWVGDILTVVEGLNQSMRLPARPNP